MASNKITKPCVSYIHRNYKHIHSQLATRKDMYKFSVSICIRICIVRYVYICPEIILCGRQQYIIFPFCYENKFKPMELLLRMRMRMRIGHERERTNITLMDNRFSDIIFLSLCQMPRKRAKLLWTKGILVVPGCWCDCGSVPMSNDKHRWSKCFLWRSNVWFLLLV